jgi:hypothetical protein
VLCTQGQAEIAAAQAELESYCQACNAKTILERLPPQVRQEACNCGGQPVLTPPPTGAGPQPPNTSIHHAGGPVPTQPCNCGGPAAGQPIFTPLTSTPPPYNPNLVPVGPPPASSAPRQPSLQPLPLPTPTQPFAMPHINPLSPQGIVTPIPTTGIPIQVGIGAEFGPGGGFEGYAPGGPLQVGPSIGPTGAF